MLTIIYISKNETQWINNVMFTIEPGNRNGLKETHSNNGASYSEFLQQIHHIRTPLSITFYTYAIFHYLACLSMWAPIDLNESKTDKFLQQWSSNLIAWTEKGWSFCVLSNSKCEKLTFVSVLREPKKQTTTRQRTKSSRLWYKWSGNSSSTAVMIASSPPNWNTQRK